MISSSRLDRHGVSQSAGQKGNQSTSDLRNEPQLASQVTQACRRGSKSLRCPAAVPNGPEHSSYPTDASAVSSREKELYRYRLNRNHS